MASFACGASRAHPGGQSGDRPRLWVRLRRPGPCDLPCRFVRLGHRGPGRDLHRRGHGDQLYAGILHLELRRRHAGSGAVVRKLPHLGGPFLRYGGVLRGAGHRREQYRRKSGLAHLVLRRRGRFPYGGPHAGPFAHGGTFSHDGSHRHRSWCRSMRQPRPTRHCQVQSDGRASVLGVSASRTSSITG